MSKCIGAINMTLDAFCDHTAIDPDEEIHYHYANLLQKADVILYGRITYELMKYWQLVLENPGSDQSMYDFARSIDKIPKIVFSQRLTDTGWESATLAKKSIAEEVADLRQQNHRTILVGSRSLIMEMIEMNLLNELQLCIHPVIAGKGLPLFENLWQRKLLSLEASQTFGSGAVLHTYSVRQ